MHRRCSASRFLLTTSQNPGLPETLATAYNPGMCLLVFPMIGNGEFNRNKKDICLTGADVFYVSINFMNKIKQCCLQLWKDERSFWKLFFCGKHLLFQLWKSRQSLREEQS